MIHGILPNPGSIMAGLTFYELQPSDVNTDRILPEFCRKWQIMQKLDWYDLFEQARMFCVVSSIHFRYFWRPISVKKIQGETWLSHQIKILTQ